MLMLVSWEQYRGGKALDWLVMLMLMLMLLF
jgi:hypothetical protein